MVVQRFPESPAPDISVHAVAFPESADTAEDLVEQLTRKPGQRLAS
jgi:hypothetical protein